ncbi:formylglycine-generating enzyme family protein [Myxococcota bacterium]
MSCGRSDPIPCTDTCQNPGDTRCNGVVLQVCADADRNCSQWQDRVDCDYYDQVCRESGGSAECSRTCSDNCDEEGKTRCDGTVVQICALGEKGCLGWVSGTDCSVFEEVCDVTQGQAHCTVICEHECATIGSTGCGGTFILTCAVNYYGCFYWKFGHDCADEGLICDDSGGATTCGPCVPDCSGRQCGPDPICGENCGTCMGATEVCRLNTGICEDVCAGKDCGTYEGIYCGACEGATEICREDTGLCEDVCAGKDCGTYDGIYCGTCAGSAEVCRLDTGLCEDVCAEKECGTYDGIYCGSCEGATEICRLDTGLCEDVCIGRECGIIESVNCGECSGPTEVCRSATGLCEEVCLWRECGVVEGIVCGTCPSDETCLSGTCQLDPSALLWIEILGGSFMMGSENGDDDERPVHRVDVPTFEMTKTEVTVEQYKACVDASVCTVPDEYPANPYCNWGKPDRLDHPMNCVNWNQAGAFCRWSGVRLPTEAQWEYAARSGGEDIEYPWGDETATCQYTVMDEGGDGCGMDRTWAVCGKTAGNTAHGLCDMSGNVYEWVRDQYHDSYVGAPTDGSAWEDLWFGDRVSRGNCFKCSGSNGLRTSFRAFFSNPPTVAEIMGIRCARPIEP